MKLRLVRRQALWIDAAKAAGTTVAGIAGASVGAALAGLVVSATAPAWLPGSLGD